MESNTGNQGSLPTNAQNSPLFTCMACQVAFYSADQQRTHYRTDWHRYNLKRKVAELPPVTAESFAQRVLAQQAKTAEAAKKAQFSADCTVCRKTYGSENAFKNHLVSKKHKEAEAKMVQRMQDEEDLRAEQAAIEESLANAHISSAAAVAAAAASQQVQADSKDAVAVTDNANESAAATAGEKNLKISDFPISDDEGESESSYDDDSEDEEEDDDEEDDVEPVQGSEKQAGDESAESALRKIEREVKHSLQQATSEEQVVEILEKKKKTAPRLNIDIDCLFCTHKSDAFEANMSHMSLAHSLFIPDLEYLVDLRGLIKYLADKLSVANVCLYCNGRGRALQSLDAVRKHMLDKGHTKIAYETEIDVLEIADFYDFSSTYPDAEEHDADEEIDPAYRALVKVGGRHNAAGAIEEEDGELVLPSGARIGHRSLQRYYKQSIPAERPEKDSVVIHKMLTDYSENPQLSTQLIQSRQNRAMIMAMPKGRQAIKDFVTYKEKRARQDFSNRIGMRMNNLQKHYREANPI
ncbi:pre-60S factor rei1 [Coemansia erecta]|nr:pre-60S factor rei1 [Coemansia erecta]KAJ2888439.1 pre-60S factor rei1 [Coemansia asiatica]